MTFLAVGRLVVREVGVPEAASTHLTWNVLEAMEAPVVHLQVVLVVSSTPLTVRTEKMRLRIRLCQDLVVVAVQASTEVLPSWMVA